MSYDVQLCRKAAQNHPNFWEENEHNNSVCAFTKKEINILKDKLSSYGYYPTRLYEGFQCYEKKGFASVTAMLTNNVLYFTAKGDDIFEISMDCSEMVDDNFVKYDPQVDEWEEAEWEDED